MNLCNKWNLREFISWRTAHNKAVRKLHIAEERQAVYFIVKDGLRFYKQTTWKMWKIMKPGTLACVMQRPDPNLNGVFPRRFVRINHEECTNQD